MGQSVSQRSHDLYSQLGEGTRGARVIVAAQPFLHCPCHSAVSSTAFRLGLAGLEVASTSVGMVRRFVAHPSPLRSILGSFRVHVLLVRSPRASLHAFVRLVMTVVWFVLASRTQGLDLL